MNKKSKASRKPREDGIVFRLQARYEGILSELEPRGVIPTTTSQLLDLLDYGDGSKATRLRKLQRDLDHLEAEGKVRKEENGWIWSEENRDSAFAERAKSASLKLLLETFDMALPQDIHRDLKRPLAAARRQLDALYREDPRIRWISALRVASGHHPVTDPILDMEVVEEIESAILKGVQVKLSWRKSGFGGDGGLAEETGSISHYLLEVPGRPSIEFWPKGGGRPVRIRLEDIEEIGRLEKDERATWPADHDPKWAPSYMAIVSGSATADGTRVVLRVDGKALAKMEKTKLRLQPEWKVEKADGDWSTVSFRAVIDLQLYWALIDMKGVVILRPTILSKFAVLDIRAKYNQYKEAYEMGLVKMLYDEEQAENDGGRLVVSGE